MNKMVSLGQKIAESQKRFTHLYKKAKLYGQNAISSSRITITNVNYFYIVQHCNKKTTK